MDPIKSVLKFLSEAENKTKTKTKTSSALGGIDFSAASDQPLASAPKERERSKPDTPTLKKGSRQDTERATAGITPTDQMRDMIGRMRDIDIDHDDPGYPDDDTTLPSRQVTVRNLPTVANKALAAKGTITPTFHQVARLPGNMSAGIRTLGRKLFKSMTNTPTDEIYMIGDLGGMGPNNMREVNAVANFVVKNGEKVTEGDIDFDNIMPGYSAQMKQYSAAGIRWLLVKDFAGNYIYCWPEEQSKNPVATRELPQDLDEGLIKNLALAAALIASVAGVNINHAKRLMREEPQLVKLADFREQAVRAGDAEKVKELDRRIKTTLDHIIVKGRPVLDPQGNPVDPKY